MTGSFMCHWTGLQVPRHVVKHSECPWDCFWARLTLNQQTSQAIASLMWVDPIQSVEELNKKAGPTLSKRGFLLPACLWVGTSDFFSAFESQLTNCLFLDFKTDNFWADTIPLALLSLQLVNCRSWDSVLVFWRNLTDTRKRETHFTDKWSVA